jgi:Kef-type K+ transport system membrane component KefB
VDVLSYAFFSPIFFASIGLSISFAGFTPNLLWFSLALLAVAVLTKFFASFVACRIFKFTARESTQVGVAMISLVEVALIIATRGLSMGMLPAHLFSAVVLAVVVTTIIQPILLKFVFKEKREA